MSEWTPTTDDDLPVSDERISRIYDGIKETGAGQAEVTTYEDEDGTIRQWSLVLAEGPTDVVAVHIDWRTGDVTTAWRVS